MTYLTCTNCNAKFDDNNELMCDDYCQECWKKYCNREWWKATEAIMSHERKKWSQIIDTNIHHGTNQQRLSLLVEIVATSEHHNCLLADVLIDEQ